MVVNGELIRGEMELEIGISRCRVLYMELISSKVLVYDTENYVQLRMINCNGKECLQNHCGQQM